MMNWGNKIPAANFPTVRQKLLDADDGKSMMLHGLDLKIPMTAFWLNFFLGGFGADYFYLGKTGLGIVKLLTCGGAGIWSLINLFTITGMTRQVNYQKIMSVL